VRQHGSCLSLKLSRLRFRAQCFYDQTDQRIHSGIRKKNPVELNAEMEMKTSKNNWASHINESPHNPFGWIYRTWEGWEGIKCQQPATSKPGPAQIAILRFMPPLLRLAFLIIPLIPPNSKRDPLGPAAIAGRSDTADSTALIATVSGRAVA